MARLDEVKSDELVPTVVFQRLTAEKPETLREIGRAWGLPVGAFVQWFTTEHAGLYEQALRVLADQDAQEVVAIADGADPASVQVAKLRTEARKWRAGKWDRERYGDKTDVRHTGVAPTLVIEISPQPEPAGRVIEAEPI